MCSYAALHPFAGRKRLVSVLIRVDNASVLPCLVILETRKLAPVVRSRFGGGFSIFRTRGRNAAGAVTTHGSAPVSGGAISLTDGKYVR